MHDNYTDVVHRESAANTVLQQKEHPIHFEQRRQVQSVEDASVVAARLGQQTRIGILNLVTIDRTPIPTK